MSIKIVTGLVIGGADQVEVANDSPRSSNVRGDSGDFREKVRLKVMNAGTVNIS